MENLKEFIKTQQESLSAHQAEEIAKINGFYQGAGAAFNAVLQFVEKSENAEKQEHVIKNAKAASEIPDKVIKKVVK